MSATLAVTVTVRLCVCVCMYVLGPARINRRDWLNPPVESRLLIRAGGSTYAVCVSLVRVWEVIVHCHVCVSVFVCMCVYLHMTSHRYVCMCECVCACLCM